MIGVCSWLVVDCWLIVGCQCVACGVWLVIDGVWCCCRTDGGIRCLLMCLCMV